MVSLTVKGQDATSLLTDGRCWHYDVKLDFGSDIFTKDFKYAFIYGDTIIGDRRCKKLYVDSGYDADYNSYYWWFAEYSLGGRYHSAWYEDGKKVYRILKGSSAPELMFDFGLKEGESLPHDEKLVYWYDDYITVNGYIKGNGTNTETRTYRRMRFAEGGLTENPKLSDWCLIEGVGGNEGLLYTAFQTAPENDFIYVTFLHCDQFIGNDENGYPEFDVFFSKGDFLTNNNVSDRNNCMLVQENMKQNETARPNCIKTTTSRAAVSTVFPPRASISATGRRSLWNNCPFSSEKMLSYEKIVINT